MIRDLRLAIRFRKTREHERLKSRRKAKVEDGERANHVRAERKSGKLLLKEKLKKKNGERAEPQRGPYDLCEAPIPKRVYSRC